jgi:cell division protein FtsZ
MLEVQDAANVITEAIDPDAKVIFGAVTDPSLKKGQLRVTVIATGFPEASQRSSLFGTPQRLVTTKKDQDVPPVNARAREEMSAGGGSSLGGKKTEPPTPERVKEPIKQEAPKAPPIVEEDDDMWGGLPSFLRRK